MKDFKIEITSDQVETRSFTSKEGKPITFREQEAYFHLDGKYPTQGKLQLGDSPALSPGFYTFGPGSFYVGKYKTLEIARQPMFIKLA